jgi:hypothetical protein
MSSPYRINNPDIGITKTSARRKEEKFNFYLERLMKMIPTEVVGLYIVGSGVIPENRPVVLVIWTILCLIGVFVMRMRLTEDREKKKPTDWIHVAISSVAFVIWVYTVGGPFKVYNLYEPFIGSLMVLGWTFFIPLFYKGPKN